MCIFVYTFAGTNFLGCIFKLFCTNIFPANYCRTLLTSYYLFVFIMKDYEEEKTPEILSNIIIINRPQFSNNEAN